MSTLHVMLGPTPCHGCGLPVMWIRAFDGIKLVGVYHDVKGNRHTAPHECRPRLGL